MQGCAQGPKFGKDGAFDRAFCFVQTAFEIVREERRHTALAQHLAQTPWGTLPRRRPAPLIPPQNSHRRENLVPRRPPRSQLHEPRESTHQGRILRPPTSLFSHGELRVSKGAPQRAPQWQGCTSYNDGHFIGPKSGCELLLDPGRNPSRLVVEALGFHEVYRGFGDGSTLRYGRYESLQGLHSRARFELPKLKHQLQPQTFLGFNEFENPLEPWRDFLSPRFGIGS